MLQQDHDRNHQRGQRSNQHASCRHILDHFNPVIIFRAVQIAQLLNARIEYFSANDKADRQDHKSPFQDRKLQNETGDDGKDAEDDLNPYGRMPPGVSQAMKGRQEFLFQYDEFRGRIGSRISSCKANMTFSSSGFI